MFSDRLNKNYKLLPLFVNILKASYPRLLREVGDLVVRVHTETGLYSLLIFLKLPDLNLIS